MAVYTALGTEELAELIAAYDVGELVSAKGIAEGVSNSNWMIDTTRGRYILTMYERRIDLDELPFFLDLLDHLSAADCPVPRTIHDSTGASARTIRGKTVALIEYLAGTSPSRPTPDQAHSVGAALAQVHLAGRQFGRDRTNRLGPAANAGTLRTIGGEALARIDPAMRDLPARATALAEAWPANLPRSVIHSDLFPDNVLMRGDAVTGLIDFYFACTDAMAYDLAVTHAAWSFESEDAGFVAPVGRALVSGYESVRPLSAEEFAALPLLAEGACLRFAASRAEDWISTPDDALVTRKDPMEFVQRWNFYRDAGAKAFARAA